MEERRIITEPPEKLLLEFGSEILSSPRFLKLKNVTQHMRSNTYDHSVKVTLKALHLAKKMKVHVHPSALVRGCLLHDYFLYDPHGADKKRFHLRFHGIRAAKNAMRDFGINTVETDMIMNHMWPLHPFRFPICVEGWLLILADKQVSCTERFDTNPIVIDN